MFDEMSPKKISLSEWSLRFRKIEDKTIKEFTYYDNKDWGIYLSPPATFMVYGARELKRLKFDNSLASLRLWGFIFNESERLFRAKQSDMKIVATLGDLGTVPAIVMAFPDCIPFYPECIWWTPFFNESTVLLDTASELGTPEAACFVRSTLAAFYKKAYFPKPDILFASTGASCDDYSCIMQLVEDLGYNPIWLEIPFRRRKRGYHIADEYERTPYGLEYPKRFEQYLATEYRKVWKEMVKLTGIDDLELLHKSIKKVNLLRRLVEKIKKLCSQAEQAPFPALEMMVIEFGNLYGYADLDEWLDILEMVYATMSARVQKKTGVLGADAFPIAWITPSAEPYLLNLVEDMGCRVVETEYVINQALVEIEENIDPFLALARSFLNASLIGSTEERAKRIIEGVETGRIAGVLITNMLGCSHCAMETRLLEQKLSKVPVLSIDVPAPFAVTEQIKSRIAAFVETMKCVKS